MRNRFLRVTMLFVLAGAGVILYADMRSVHQIYRISEAMINTAPDAQTRQNLIADRDKRDREEWRHKFAIGTALVIDALVFAWVSVGVFRRVGASA